MADLNGTATAESDDLGSGIVNPDKKRRSKNSSTVNTDVARNLNAYADLLTNQGANEFRIRAYRNAASTVTELKQAVDQILSKEGREGLIAIPTIGKGIAAAISEMVVTGQWTQLERLRGDVSPATLFQSIPGIGEELSARLADELQLETLEDLEAALYLDELPVKGLGPRRKEAIAAVLEKKLGRPNINAVSREIHEPSVDLLLQVDEMYRQRAAEGTLNLIAPKRFNASKLECLPVLHASHDNWHFTALYSNTARAHRLKMTTDWVVIYYQADGYAEGRCTVVTETRGLQIGLRVVRGRETECRLLRGIHTG